MIKRGLKILIIALLAAMLCAAAAFAADSDYVPCSVSLGGSKISSDAWLFRGTPYISLDTLKTYGDTGSFTISEKDDKIYFELSRLNLYIADKATTEFIRTYGGRTYIYIKGISGKSYVALNAIAQFAKLGYELDGTNINIFPYSSSEGMATVNGDGVMAAGSLSEGSGRNVELARGQMVFIKGETAFSYKVATMAGDILYVAKDQVSKAAANDSLLDFQYSAKAPKDYSGQKINLVWYNMAGTTLKEPDEKGIDIISPTWFRQIVNGNGEVYNYGNKGFVDLCHNNGIDVWVTVNNSMTTTGSTKYTTSVLTDKVMRNKVIAQYLFYSALYDIDGINVDYEDLTKADKENFTVFVSEFAKYAHNMGLKISMAPLVPTAENTGKYDYAALGSVCDYITLMSYDQHYSKASGAGSVSAYSWAKGYVETLLKYVPSEKVLMGVPFYTRVWTVNGSGTCIGMATVKMGRARELVEEAVGKYGRDIISWDASCRQYVATYPGNDGTIKIWLESERSVANRLTLVYDYDLAGTCCWEYTQPESGIYDLFYRVYRGGEDPDIITADYLR